MKHFPAPAARRPSRLAGLEDSLSFSRRDNGPRWSLFWRMLAMGIIAVAAGLCIAVVAWHSA
jgi:hypothetical protein